MQRDVVKSVKCFDPISDRVMRVDLMTEKGVLSVVVEYAPSEQSKDEEKDLYYQQLDLAMQKNGSLVIVLGDFNARIGQERSPITGNFGLAKQLVTME